MSRTYRKRRKRVRIGLILLAIMPTVIMIGIGIFSVLHSRYHKIEVDVHGIPEDVDYGGIKNQVIVKKGTIENAPRISFDNPAIVVGTTETDFQLTRGVYLTDDKDSSEELFTRLKIVSAPKFNQQVATTYTVQYTVEDSDGNKAIASRTVEIVEDVTTNTPRIVLSPSIVEIEVGEKYDLRKGVTVSNGDPVLLTLIQIESEPEFRIDVPGEYKIHYFVTDEQGTKISATRLIVVKKASTDTDQAKDREKPEIMFESNPVTFPKGKPIDVNAGVSVSDNVDSANALLANMKVTLPPELNRNNPKAGEYSIIYEVTDFSGNTRFRTRTVIVK